MVSDIILRNLSTPPVKGTSAPLISTKVGQRDGTRAGGGGGGGSTGLYDINNLTYLGAFALSEPGGDATIQFSYGSIGFHPPHGGNGNFGSIFVSGRTKKSSPDPEDDCNIAEWQIPETLETSLLVTTADTLPKATALQPFVRIENTTAGSDGLGKTLTSIGHNYIGSMCVVDGKLFVYTTIGYNQSQNQVTPTLETLSVFSDAKNLSLGGTGFGNLSAPDDKAHNWMVPIPAERQAALGGTHLFGSGNSKASFDPMASQGPSLFVGTPENYTPGTELTVTPYMWFSDNNTLASRFPRPADWKGTYAPNYDAYGQALLTHYLSFFGDTSITTYLTPPTGNPCFQAYKDWHDSSPRVDWSTLPPPPGPVNDLWFLSFSDCACGFIVPNTNTYLVIGSNIGAKYGGGYKFPQFQTAWGVTPGPAPVDSTDAQPSFYWAFNLDEILSAENFYDPFPYAYGELVNKPPAWQRKRSVPELSKTYSGCVDYANRRYYQTRFEVKEGSLGAVPVIEVYSF